MFVDVKGYEGLYQINEEGIIKTLYDRHGKERIIKSTITEDLYLKINLTKDKKLKTLLTHRLVALTFIPNPNNYPCVLHGDNNPSNPHKNNLRWGTKKENNEQRHREGRTVSLVKGKFGKDHPRSKKVLQISKDGEVIKEWGGLHEAARNLNIRQGNISSCCHGKIKSIGGFIWKFSTLH